MVLVSSNCFISVVDEGRPLGSEGRISRMLRTHTFPSQLKVGFEPPIGARLWAVLWGPLAYCAVADLLDPF